LQANVWREFILPPYIAGASDTAGKSPPSDHDQLSILKWTGIILILPGAQARPASQY
jgi:hypothetical protein